MTELSELNTQVTAAITRAMWAPRGSAAEAEAWLDVSEIEERIAHVTQLDSADGAIARRGAVRAAMHARDLPRAYRLVEAYIGEFRYFVGKPPEEPEGPNMRAFLSMKLDEQHATLESLRNDIVSRMKGETMAAVNAKVDKPHPWAFWFAKPVMVQLREPLALFTDGGPVEVHGVTPDGKDVTTTYGGPQGLPGADKQGPPAALQINGELQPDPAHPDRLILSAELTINDQKFRFLTSIDPATISYVSVIPTHTPKSTVIAPRGGIVTP